jgi:hypothetical protein
VTCNWAVRKKWSCQGEGVDAGSLGSFGLMGGASLQKAAMSLAVVVTEGANPGRLQVVGCANALRGLQSEREWGEMSFPGVLHELH